MLKPLIKNAMEILQWQKIINRKAYDFEFLAEINQSKIHAYSRKQLHLEIKIFEIASKSDKIQAMKYYEMTWLI